MFETYRMLKAENERLKLQTDGLRAELRRLNDQLAKLQAFKDWVHAYLDKNGVPHHPPGPHGAEGCRIGDRMDWLMGQFKLNVDLSKQVVVPAEFVEQCRELAKYIKVTWPNGMDYHPIFVRWCERVERLFPEKAEPERNNECDWEVRCGSRSLAVDAWSRRGTPA